MSYYPVGMILGLIFTGLTFGALFLPTREAREIVWAMAAVIGFWALVIAILV